MTEYPKNPMEWRLQELTARFKYSRPVLVGLILLCVHVLATHFANFSEGPTICPIKLFFGFPCPMCGTTRAIGALSRGEIVTSLRFNPMGVVVAYGMVLWAFPSTKSFRFVERKTKLFLSKPRIQLVLVSFFIYVLLWTLDWVRVRSHFYIG